MHLSLSPIVHFQKVRKEEAEELFRAVRTSWMTSALTYSLSEMSMRNATKEELVGARIFIGILMNLAEPIPEPAPAAPSKELGQPPEKQK